MLSHIIFQNEAVSPRTNFFHTLILLANFNTNFVLLRTVFLSIIIAFQKHPGHDCVQNKNSHTAITAQIRYSWTTSFGGEGIAGASYGKLLIHVLLHVASHFCHILVCDTCSISTVRSATRNVLPLPLSTPPNTHRPRTR